METQSYDVDGPWINLMVGFVDVTATAVHAGHIDRAFRRIGIRSCTHRDIAEYLLSENVRAGVCEIRVVYPRFNMVFSQWQGGRSEDIRPILAGFMPHPSILPTPFPREPKRFTKIEGIRLMRAGRSLEHTVEDFSRYESQYGRGSLLPDWEYPGIPGQSRTYDLVRYAYQVDKDLLEYYCE